MPNLNLMQLAAAVVVEQPPEVNVIGTVLTAVISSGVISAAVVTLGSYFTNRRNARIAERKNDLDAEAGLIGRYKEAAAEERAQKESAIQTVNNMLAIAQTQVDTLKSTVDTLNRTIEAMNMAANAQQDIIDQLIKDRDYVQDSLTTAMAEIERQKEELLRRQREILELTNPKRFEDTEESYA